VPGVAQGGADLAEAARQRLRSFDVGPEDIAALERAGVGRRTIFRHFATIADAVSVPVVVYNVPSRTGSNIDTKTQLRLAAHPNITAVKEASGKLTQVIDILRDRPEGSRCSPATTPTPSRSWPWAGRRDLRRGQPGTVRCTTWSRPARAATSRRDAGSTIGCCTS
jgi:hypothetical protein